MIQPIRDNVLVKPLPKDNVLSSGLIVPDSCVKESNKIIIVAVGNGTSGKPMKRKVGEIGYRVKDWGEEIIIDGQTHYLMNQAAVIALD